jgi:hypothetical protein
VGKRVAFLILAGLLAACQDSDPPTSPSPSAKVRDPSTPQEAFDVLAQDPRITTLKCEELPGLDPGETGVLHCGKIAVSDGARPWDFIIWFFDDSFFPEDEYRKGCEPGLFSGKAWLVWEDGQRWIGEVRDRTIVIAKEKSPPQLVANTIADALGSSAWRDCSGVDDS